MFKFIAHAALFLCLPLMATAQENQAVQACAALPANLARLACYDSLFRKQEKEETTVPQETTEQVPPDLGKWVSRTEVSPIDDTKNVYLSLISEGTIRGRFSGSGPMQIYIQCRENTTLFYITFNGLFMSDHRHGTVTYRLGATKAKTIKMSESNNNQALGLWSGGRSIPFIKQLFEHETLLIRASPHSESAVTATFNITGLENAIKPLRASCNW